MIKKETGTVYVVDGVGSYTNYHDAVYHALRSIPALRNATVIPDIVQHAEKIRDILNFYLEHKDEAF